MKPQTKPQNPIQTITEILQNKFHSSTTPITIAIGGPGGTGKSSFAKKLMQNIPNSKILHLDHYKTSRQERKQKNLQGPHPEANNINLLSEHLQLLKQNKSFNMPIYNRETGNPDSTQQFTPAKFNILDGEISTYKCFIDSVDFSIFIDSDIKTQLYPTININSKNQKVWLGMPQIKTATKVSDDRKNVEIQKQFGIKTRLERDVNERGHTLEKAINTFLYSNLTEFPEHGAESKQWSDVKLFCEDNYEIVFENV